MLTLERDLSTGPTGAVLVADVLTIGAVLEVLSAVAVFAATAELCRPSIVSAFTRPTCSRPIAGRTCFSILLT
jgi:hypothetical protein